MENNQNIKTYGDVVRIAQEIKANNPEFGINEILAHPDFPICFYEDQQRACAEYADFFYGKPTPYGSKPEPGRPITTVKPDDWDLYADAR